MIRSTDIQPATYKGGQFLRRWSINENGQAVCVVDAYPVADTEQATLDADRRWKNRVENGAVTYIEVAKRGVDLPFFKP